MQTSKGYAMPSIFSFVGLFQNPNNKANNYTHFLANS